MGRLFLLLRKTRPVHRTKMVNGLFKMAMESNRELYHSWRDFVKTLIGSGFAGV